MEHSEHGRSRRLSPGLLGLAGLLILLLLCLGLLWERSSSGSPAQSAWTCRVVFRGEYRLGQGPWLPLDEHTRLPASREDVTMVGLFYLLTPDSAEELGPAPEGTRVGFYCDHVGLEIYEDGSLCHISDAENPSFGKDSCISAWTGYAYAGGSQVRLELKQVHLFGNAQAARTLLSSMSILVEETLLSWERQQGGSLQSLGSIFVMVALMILAIALFSSLLHIRNVGQLWLVGGIILAAGLYFIYGSPGAGRLHGNESAATVICGLSMMLYMLLLAWLALLFLEGRRRRLAAGLVWVLGTAVAAAVLLPLLSPVYFYDTWFFWALLQCAGNLCLLALLLPGLRGGGWSRTVVHAACCCAALGFFLDLLAAWRGWWQTGLVSRHVFVLLFVAGLILVLRVVPRNFQDAARARELQAQQKALKAELQEQRIATMISQIQPHFIYNTLSGIEQLCLEQPQRASELVRSFSAYLRGNFSQLDDISPISFQREMEHVKHYTYIEQVRFPDISIVYELQATEFLLPGLTVQPLVENAIQHGLMGLEEGGCVKISSYETEESYCVQVEDDGVGFDPALLDQPGEHVGIRNIRGRLQAICGGSLEIRSAPGRGTCALLRIPREQPRES